MKVKRRQPLTLNNLMHVQAHLKHCVLLLLLLLLLHKFIDQLINANTYRHANSYRKEHIPQPEDIYLPWVYWGLIGLTVIPMAVPAK